MEASRRDGRDLDLLGARDEIHIPSVRADAHVGLQTGVVLRARPPEDHGGGGGGGESTNSGSWETFDIYSNCLILDCRKPFFPPCYCELTYLNPFVSDTTV